MSPDSEGLGAAVEAGVGSNLTQPCGISYFSIYIESKEYIHTVLYSCLKSSFTTFIFISNHLYRDSSITGSAPKHDTISLMWCSYI